MHHFNPPPQKNPQDRNILGMYATIIYLLIKSVRSCISLSISKILSTSNTVINLLTFSSLHTIHTVYDMNVYR